MDAKQTLWAGIGALVLGILLCLFPGVRAALVTVLAGAVALLVLLAGVLFVIMGVVQVREDRELLAKEQQEAAARQAMAADK